MGVGLSYKKRYIYFFWFYLFLMGNYFIYHVPLEEDSRGAYMVLVGGGGDLMKETTRKTQA